MKKDVQVGHESIRSGEMKGEDRAGLESRRGDPMLESI